MALPALLNGADCGPVNPLQALSKQFDRDRGIQQDQFGPGRAGSSREVFRTQTAPAPGLNDEVARFFSGQSSPRHSFALQHTPDAFDFSVLHGSLPAQQQPPPSAWAGDFLNQQPAVQKLHPDPQPLALRSPDADRWETQRGPDLLPMNNTFLTSGFRSAWYPPGDAFLPERLRHQSEVETATIFEHFPPEEIQRPVSVSEPIDADELARTAGLLIETVKDESNPKFQNSAFLGLMRQLRDREMVVEGADISKASGSPAPTTEWVRDFADAANVKGKGKARDVGGWADAFPEATQSPVVTAPAGLESRDIRRSYRDLVAADGLEEVRSHGRESGALSTPRKYVHFDHPEVLKHDFNAMDQDDEDRYWRQENADYQEYWKTADAARPLHPHGASPEWDRLQADWDRFEATATGIRPVTVYQFQPHNPYLLGDSSTRNHAIHIQRVEPQESILEKEAAVQNDLRNPVSWFELGVKQQENEREAKAIQALERAVELDPSYLEAWLALAISRANENDKSGAYDAMEQWVRNNKRYKRPRLMSLLEKDGGRTAGERHEELIQCLVGLARSAPEGEIDADIQTALGVLLNTAEEYEKAQDCFQTALAVRPNDWLLYNRVGATLANRGRADEALEYYYRALDLNPSYIRARFNLGISCINMKRYIEAAGHIMDALALQENDISEGADMRGITSSALWDCLRTTCVQLQRMELTAFCDARDLEGFRNAFGM